MEDKMKRFCMMMLIAPLLGIIMLTCICLQATKTISLSINGFAVDSEGYLYVGKDFGIEVFQENTLIRTVSPKTSLGYKFTIIDGENILLSTGSVAYTMDLFGNVLSEKEDEGTKLYNELQWKRDFVDENGARYTLESHWGRKCICREGEIIYQVPTLDYAVKIIMIACGVLTIALVIFTVAPYRFKNNKRQNA